MEKIKPADIGVWLSKKTKTRTIVMKPGDLYPELAPLAASSLMAKSEASSIFQEQATHSAVSVGRGLYIHFEGDCVGTLSGIVPFEHPTCNSCIKAAETNHEV